MNEYKQEVWYARELQEALAYSQWRSFKEVIEKAMDACKASGNQVYDHFCGSAQIGFNWERCRTRS